MQDILTVTPNPALDLGTTAPKVAAGPKLRCTLPVAEPGGGGINVSRAIAHLGGTSRALVALGGPTGDALAALLIDHDLDVLRMPAPGDTRQSLAVTDQTSGAQYRFVFPGPTWATRDVDALRAMIVSNARRGSLVVLSGSLPPGCPDSLMSDLCGALAPAGARVIADTSGAPLAGLAAGRSAPAFVLRMDSEEAEGLAGSALPERTDTARFAQSLVDKGAAVHVIIARGADGSVLVGPDGAWHATAADVPVVSKIGAGDSFVGALTLAIARGQSLPEALRAGAAAASAAVMTAGTELCRREDAERLTGLCDLSRLD